MKKFLIALFYVAVHSNGTVSAAEGKGMIEAEVCVFGGTAAGVAAACTAAKLGHQVVLTESGTHIGGLTSGGLGWTDIGNKAAIGGFARRFYERLGKHYQKPIAWTFEPSVAERELRKLLEESKVPVYYKQQLASVKKEGGNITEITMADGSRYRAKVFIDCSYEGDLMAKAGVQYLIGREANAYFGETLNGIREKTPSHQFQVAVDPYVKLGDVKSGLLPFIQDMPFGQPGAGDACVQAYNFRLCLTKNPANRIAITPPEGYDPKRYELLGRYLEALSKEGRTPTLKMFLKIDMVTPEKTDINNNGAFSTDFIGMNYAYPDADEQTRRKIWREHENYIKGFLVFLGTDPRVPEEMRREMQAWGYPKDEFTDTGGWPHAMYVREARRMLSDYVMTEADCRWDRVAPDPVGLGAYNMDSHNCRRVVRHGKVENEGDVQVRVRGPYPVSYRSIVPRQSECENLFVPVCLSATHIAYGSIRMEPVFMIMGQSAATAAHLALAEKLPVQKVPYEKLEAMLLQDGQVLKWDSKATGQSADHRDAVPRPKLPGIVLDDAEAIKNGDWAEGSLGDYRVGQGYVHDGNENKEGKSLSWDTKLPEAGEYEAVLHFTVNPNRASNIPVTVEINGEQKITLVNQRTKQSAGKAVLGRFKSSGSASIRVRVDAKGTDGFVVVDGLQLQRVN